MVRNKNFEILFSKDWDWGGLVTRFGKLVLLKSQRSHLDTPSYLVGYIIIKADRVVPLRGYGFTSGTK